MSDLWNVRAGKADTYAQDDLSIVNVAYGSMQVFMNDRANEGYTKFTVWKS